VVEAGFLPTAYLFTSMSYCLLKALMQRQGPYLLNLKREGGAYTQWVWSPKAVPAKPICIAYLQNEASE
jgi:hypothetical protein